MTALRTLVVGLALVALTACSAGGGLGALGNILGTLGGAAGGQGQQGQQGQIQAEIQQVDTNSQRLHLRTQSGESGSVRFDGNTEVIYRQQRYPVTALERGDIVNLTVQQISGNELYASRVDVVQSVQERTGR